MSKKFDHGRPHVYFAPNFWKNHIFVGNAGEKKKAENVFLRRGVAVSTVVCLTRIELVQLAGEIHRRQAEFDRNPRLLFTTEHAYDYWSRGGHQAKDKQRATFSTRRFRYKVRINHEGIYTLCHFEDPA
jgi:hypothetical protein